MALTTLALTQATGLLSSGERSAVNSGAPVTARGETMRQAGRGRAGTAGTALAVCLALGPAVACDDPVVTVLHRDVEITFANTRPYDTGWIDAMDAGGTQLDLAGVVIETNVPVTVSWSTGSDLRLEAGNAWLPLQFAARVRGRGRWSGGQCFDTGAHWSPWSTWHAAGGPGAGEVWFEADQVFALVVRARAQRSGLSDPAGVYRQPEPLVLTFAVESP